MGKSSSGLCPRWRIGRVRVGSPISNVGFGLLALCLFNFLSCGEKAGFVQPLKTDFFTQDFIPEYLDILWVIDDRSPMSNAVAKLLPQAREFFKRLATSTYRYRMGLVAADGKGTLLPRENPVLLTNEKGSVDERANQFQLILSKIINLKTRATNQGLGSAEAALKETFRPRTGVRLVLVFISDADDHSSPSSVDAIDRYADTIRNLTGNDPELLRVYSVSNFPYPESQRNADNRCATRYSADVDDQPNYQRRYFNLAERLGGKIGELCGSFAGAIDLTGLRLTNEKTRFLLEQKANPTTVSVTVFRGEERFDLPWHFDEFTNEVVFQSAPPMGATIQVTYQTI